MEQVNYASNLVDLVRAPRYVRHMLDYADQMLSILRPKYPAWDLWVVRLGCRRGSIWCARPAGTEVAIVNVESPEELVAAVADLEARGA